MNHPSKGTTVPNPTIVKASDARDFLSFIPTLIGYTPVESIVLVPFKDHRTLGAMRMDLPDPDEDLAAIASTLVGYVCKLDTADGVAIIGYSQTQDHVVMTPILQAVMARAEECGLRLVDVLYVVQAGWGSLSKGEEPQPLDELTATEVPGHAPPAGDQLSGTEMPVLSDILLMEVAGAMSTFEPEYMSDPLLLNEALLEIAPKDLEGEQIVYLSWMMDRPALRDIALVQWCRGMEAGELALDAQLDWEDGKEYPAELASVMWGAGERPDPARLTAALEVVRVAVSAVPTAGGFATAAWLSWALGRSTHAEHYATQGLALDEEHGLSEIVKSFITAGHLPEWAFQR
jgi:hypothetical protein